MRPNNMPRPYWERIRDPRPYCERLAEEYPDDPDENGGHENAQGGVWTTFEPSLQVTVLDAQPDPEPPTERPFEAPKAKAAPDTIAVPSSFCRDQRISDTEYRTLSAVLSYAWRVKGKRNPCTASVAELAARSAMSARQTHRNLRTLQQIGVLEAVPRPGRPTVYRVLDD